MSLNHEAALIAQRHKSGSSMSQIFGGSSLSNQRSKNFSQLNRDHVKHVEEKNRLQKQIEMEKDNVKPFTMRKFQNAKSVLVEEIEKKKLSSTSTSFTDKKKAASNGAKLRLRPKPSNAPAQPSLSKLLNCLDLNSVEQCETVMIDDNVTTSNNIIPISSTNDSLSDSVAEQEKDKKKIEKVKNNSLHQSFGKVPSYLIKMKLQKEENKIQEQKEREREAIPKGYRWMEEEERVKTLELLQSKKKEIMDEWKRLPLKIETLGQKNRQNAIQTKLNNVDQAIESFSKSKVLIEDDY